MGSSENEGTSGWIPPPLPEGAVPGSQDARRAADSVARMGPHRRSTQARSRLRNRALVAISFGNSRSRGLPSLPSDAAPGSQDSGDVVGSWPSSPPLPHPGATSGQRHQESSAPMEVDPVNGEALQETRMPHERRGDATGEHTEGRISTRMRARTRAAYKTGERNNRQPSGASPPLQEVGRIAQPAPQLRLVPPQREHPSSAPLPSQPGQGTLRSLAATTQGLPPTPTPPIGRSRVPVGEPLLSPVETASPPPDLRSPISPAQPRTWDRDLSPRGTQPREEGPQPTLGRRPPTPTQSESQPLQETPTTSPTTQPVAS